MSINSTIIETIANMKKFASTIVALLALTISTAVFAGNRGTADEAVSLVHKVIASMKTNGREKTIEEVNKGKFVDRDLYITIIDLKGNNVANSVNARMVGKSVMELKDADGKYFVKEALANVAANGKAWTDFKWPNPTTKEMELKSSYSERFEDLSINCGIYKRK